ncbi:SRPBCC family protein [Lutimonas saemankumensis]|uniref:SRPBCC family protein n=1 Tax=Lutimonas saemankumensis TaxID=483016 RepID=UPI001CD696DB|nr:SRPBCC family protein [Lutimonas saemankumensis]MCA0931892.1 SRPBCC family protein [Lutimonas saemankumensis]
MVEFQKQGAVFCLKAKLNMPIRLEEAWNFFSNPSNLKEITPDYMGFNIISSLDHFMYPGQIISYKVTPLFGINMNWVTEITHVEQNKFFVDEQRIGPYKIWHHKHFFKKISNGVEMTDQVHYRLPLPIVANRFHSLLIKPKLKEIFEYRTRVLVSRFGKYEKS